MPMARINGVAGIALAVVRRPLRPATRQVLRPTSRVWRAAGTCRLYASAADEDQHPPLPPPQDVAVIGGGLTGLTTAYYLSELLPATARISVYDGSDRLGGWIDSMAAPSDQQVILEGGARMVAPQVGMPRYDDLVLLDLIDKLDLLDALRVSTRKPAQYVYYPDHLVQVSLGDVKGPDGKHTDTGRLLPEGLGLLYRVLTEPVFRGVIPSVVECMWPSKKRFLKRLQRTLMTPLGRDGLQPDQSVGAFFTDKVGGMGMRQEAVDNLLSAVMHGIYGGDIWKLSVASTPFRGRWMERTVGTLVAMRSRMKEPGVLGRFAHAQGNSDRQQAGKAFAHYLDAFAWMKREGNVLQHASDLGLLVDLTERARLGEQTRPDDNGQRASRFVQLALASTAWTQMSFAGGFGRLTDALAKHLSQKPNVTLRLSEAVTQLRHAPAAGKVVVATAKNPATSYDKVISTLSSPALHRITGGALPSLREEHAVTIQAVNLHYAEAGLNRPYKGFGYLIPQTVPLEQNPESALGVIFDTDREAVLRPLQPGEQEGRTRDLGLFEEPSKASGDEDGKDGTAVGSGAEPGPPPGTTFTVLMGGHYWDDYGPKDFPTPEEAVAMAEAVVRRQLGTIPEGVRPVTTRTKLCRGCIPQHYVGHAARLATTDEELAAAFGGRLAVAGGSFTATGPGVLPSLRSARDMALRTAGRGYRLLAAHNGRNEWLMRHVGDTGLGRFTHPDVLVPRRKKEMPLRFGNTTLYSAKNGWMIEMKES